MAPVLRLHATLGKGYKHLCNPTRHPSAVNSTPKLESQGALVHRSMPGKTGVHSPNKWDLGPKTLSFGSLDP